MKSMLLNLKVICATMFLTGCYQHVVDDFNSFDGRNVEVSDEELASIIFDLQIKLLNGELPLNSLDNVMKVLGVSNTIKVPLQEFSIDETTATNLQAKLDTYINLTPSQLRSDGFVEGCDSLLFTGLLSTSDYDVDITLAESDKETGRWYRNPDKDCFSSGASESTISRDMMLGLAYSLWQSGKSMRSKLEDTLAYAKENDWYIGEASSEEERLARAFLSPGLAATFYEIQYKLGGEKNEAARTIFQYYDKDLRGFEAHLDMLNVLLRGLLRGGVPETDYAVAAYHAKREPDNLFYAAVAAAFDDGDMNDVAESLLETELFPAASLPTNHDNYCTDYLWQRDYDKKDWKPCPDEELVTHNGADFIFLANLILGNLRTVDEIDPEFAEE